MTTNRQLNSIINRCNKNFYRNIIKMELSDRTDYIHFYENNILKYNSLDYDTKFTRVFLVKKDNKYVGIVQDLGNDLHIYIQKSFRKQTDMISELNNTIIPYLFLNRKEQYLSFVHLKVTNHFCKHLKNIKQIGFNRAVIKKVKRYSNKIKIKGFSQTEFNDFKKAQIKIRKIRNKMLKYNKPAINYLIDQPYISEDDFKYLNPIERVNFNREDFNYVKKDIDYMKKLKNFYEKKCEIQLHKQKYKKIKWFIYSSTIKDIKNLTFENFNKL